MLQTSMIFTFIFLWVYLCCSSSLYMNMRKNKDNNMKQTIERIARTKYGLLFMFVNAISFRLFATMFLISIFLKLAGY